MNTGFHHLKIIFCLICMTQLSTAAFAQVNFSEIAEQALPAIVVIETPDSTGSGVIMASSGVIATNYHVVENATEITVQLSNGDTYNDVAIVDFDINRDITILKIKGFDLPTATLGNSNNLSVGEDVAVMGAPQGLAQSVSRGIVSAIRDTGEGYSLIQTDAAISPGSSGGGMFNTNGELVGITVSYLSEGQNINFVIPINYFRGMFSEQAQYTIEEFIAVQPDVSRGAIGTQSSQSVGNINVLIAELEELFEAEFEVVEDGSWAYETEYGVILIQGSDSLVYTFYFTDYNYDVLNTESLKEILELNYLYDFAKIGVNEEQLVILNESYLKSLILNDYFTKLANIIELEEELRLLIDGSTAKSENISSTNVISGSKDSTLSTLSIGPEAVARKPIRMNSGLFTVKPDPAVWESSPPANSEILHQFTSGDTFMAIIPEEIELSYEVLEGVLVENIESAPRASVSSSVSGFRMVNDKNLMWMTVDADFSGAPFRYFIHVYTGPEGTIQLVGWTSQNIFERRKSLIEDFVSTLEIHE